MKRKGDKYAMPASRLYAMDYLKEMRQHGAPAENLSAYQLTHIGTELPILEYLELPESDDPPYGKKQDEHLVFSDDISIEITDEVSAVSTAASLLEGGTFEHLEIDTGNLTSHSVNISEAIQIASGVSVIELEDIIVDKGSEIKTNANWVENWKEEFYPENTSSPLLPEAEMFEIVKPQSQSHVTIEDMPQSKFLSWLKDKEAQRKGFERKKEEEQDQKEAKQTKPTHKPTSSEKKEKISKKKKKKKLKKILKKSLEIEDEIVSETLAKIMVQQGHTDKAIEMYKKLRLIFPEKSSYFAQIIEKLEE